MQPIRHTLRQLHFGHHLLHPLRINHPQFASRIFHALASLVQLALVEDIRQQPAIVLRIRVRSGHKARLLREMSVGQLEDLDWVVVVYAIEDILHGARVDYTRDWLQAGVLLASSDQFLCVDFGKTVDLRCLAQRGAEAACAGRAAVDVGCGGHGGGGVG